MGLKITAPNPYEKHLGGQPVKPYSVKQATGNVQVAQGKKDNMKTIQDDEHVLHKGIMAPAEQLCTVSVGGGQTINLGNFESVRIDVRVEIPCAKDALDETYEFATDWVSERIQEVVKGAKGK